MKKQANAPKVLIISSLKGSLSNTKHVVHIVKKIELRVREQASMQFQ
jgi:hypothetical protein